MDENRQDKAFATKPLRELGPIPSDIPSPAFPPVAYLVDVPALVPGTNFLWTKAVKLTGPVLPRPSSHPMLFSGKLSTGCQSQPFPLGAFVHSLPIPECVLRANANPSAAQKNLPTSLTVSLAAMSSTFRILSLLPPLLGARKIEKDNEGQRYTSYAVHAYACRYYNYWS